MIWFVLILAVFIVVFGLIGFFVVVGSNKAYKDVLAEFDGGDAESDMCDSS